MPLRLFVFPRPATVVRVSTASDGTEGSAGSTGAAISADGHFVAFESFADNLVAGDTNGALDIFVHDRDTDGDGIFDEPNAIATVRVWPATVPKAARVAGRPRSAPMRPSFPSPPMPTT
jgi:hypothetical protein